MSQSILLSDGRRIEKQGSAQRIAAEAKDIQQREIRKQALRHAISILADASVGCVVTCVVRL